MINRLGEEKTASIGIILMGTSFVLILFMFNIPSSIIFMAVFSAGVGLIRPSLSAAVSKLTSSAQGAAMGIFNGYERLGRAIGPMLGGFMLDQGQNLGYYTAISVSALALLTLLIGTRLAANKESQVKERLL